MSERLHILLAAAITTLALNATVPDGYYNSLNGKSGQQLKNAVSELALRRTVHSYSSLWTYFPQTDRRPENPSQVWDMYSDKTYYFNSRPGYSTSGMNREHSLPKSWWGGYTESQGYIAYTDLNHLYPSDAEANEAKLNYPMGEVSTPTFNNGCTRVGTPVAGQGGGSSRVFEPDDRYKGDFARTYFYMAATYQAYTWKYTWMMRDLSASSWTSLQPWAINLLLKWAREDPVSDKEKARNEAVFACQNNRNPFIDNPELMEYIWGTRVGDTFVVGSGDTGGDPELVTPVQSAAYHFGDVAIGQTVTLTVYVKGLNLTGNLAVTIYSGNRDMFSASVSEIDRTVAMSEQGYPLKVTYHPTQTGEHATRLVISDGGITGSIGISLDGQAMPVPSLSTPVALPATDITDSTYVAHWEMTPDEIDFYIINRTVFDSKTQTVISTETFTTDDNEATSMAFTDRQPGQIHTYTVQTSRLGYLSTPSNVITIDGSGLTGIRADRPMALLATDGGVLVKCFEPLLNVAVYNTSGTLVFFAPELRDDDIISLPQGVYILTTTSSRQAIKVVVR